MPAADHVFQFADASDQPYLVRWENAQRGRETDFLLQVEHRRIISARPFDSRSLAFDLIDLAVAVNIADWLSRRAQDVSHHIMVHLPLRNPDLFANPSTYQKLQDILYWYTEDSWIFEFTQRVAPEHTTERRGALTEPRRKEVALWSGGLDSFSGLCSRWSDPNLLSGFLLVGTGSNDFIKKKQQSLARAVQQHLSKRIEWVQVTFQALGAGEIPKNSLFRARGFSFLLLGAAMAYLECQPQLYVYENGVGAINLRLSTAEVGLDYARSVHPKSLSLVGDLVSALVGEPFEICNPFLFHTKTQMCKPLVGNATLTHLATKTITCDRLPREPGRQCGCCTSCLLRRQALTAAGIADRTPYAVLASGYSPDYKELHLKAMLQQIATLQRLLDETNPWNALCQSFPELIEVQYVLPEGVASQRLPRLYRTYVEEWNQVGTLDIN